MPVTYDIDPERRLIRTTCSGNTTLTEVLEHFDRLEKEPNCPERLDVLLDLTGVISLPASYQLRAVADRVRRIKKPRFGMCAIVTDRDALFNMVAKFGGYAEGEFQKVEVFHRAAEAELWLAEAAGSPRR